MSKIFWKSLLIAPAILGTSLSLSSMAKAVDDLSPHQQPQAEVGAFELAQSVGESNPELLNQVESYGTEGLAEPVDAYNEQVTSVNQLRDVQPTAWAFEALRSLVERYGCIVGYPDRTFRGDRALTRWEFAAGLNACMNVMERLLQEGIAVLKEDLDKLKRLMEEFQAELAALGARVDNLEARTSFLEDHQFSTTTKLSGEVIFAVTDVFPNGDEAGTPQATMQSRARLTFSSSFTGTDRLVTRLAAGFGSLYEFDYQTTGINSYGGESFVDFSSNNPTLTQTFNLAPQDGVAIDWLAYYAPVALGDFAKFNAYVAAWGGTWYDFVPTLSPYFQDFDGGNGALSTFAQQNPIYRIGGGGGAGINFSLGLLESVLGPTSVSLGYLSNTASDSSQGAGLFNGDYAALGQINFNLFDFLSLGFTYVNSYNTPDSPIYGNVVGTELANLSLSNLQDSISGDDFENDPFNFGGKVTNSYGVAGAIRFTESISFNAFGTYSAARLVGQGDVDIWSYGAGLAFSDVGREGSVIGLFAGVQPYVGQRSLPGSPDLRFSTAKPIHLELFYKYQVTDNISITPGVIWLSKPSQARTAGDVFIGTLRGTFNF